MVDARAAAWPPGGRFRLAQALVPTCLLADRGAAGALPGAETTPLDLDIADGRIVGVAPAGSSSTFPVIDLGHGLVLPGFVDLHTHLDKGHIWPRAANPDGTFAAALATAGADRSAHWTAEDVEARMSFGLRCAYAQGTVAIRTHLDSISPQGDITWLVFARLRAAWAGRMTLQAVSIVPSDLFRTEAGRALADLVARHGGILGAVVLMTPDIDELLDRIFVLARERDLDLDFHVDESGDPAATGLARVAAATIRHGWHGRVVCGHCCSLAVQPETEALATIRAVVDAGIAVVSLPMCNLYLQDRVPGRTPRWRGVTLVHELAAAGVPVSFASDNTRDPFFAYGDLDMLEVFTEAVRIAHLDHPIGDWPRAVSVTPAKVMRLAGTGCIGVGRPADLVVLSVRTWNEALSRRRQARLVLRAGVVIPGDLPEYPALDGRLGAS